MSIKDTFTKFSEIEEPRILLCLSIIKKNKGFMHQHKTGRAINHRLKHKIGCKNRRVRGRVEGQGY